MKRILVTGASGFLGSHVARRLASGGHHVTGTFARHEDRFRAVLGDTAVDGRCLDLIRPESITELFAQAAPNCLVHCAALADPTTCQQDASLARAVNVDATVRLAGLCRENGARMLFFSTDQVFDGTGSRYREDAPPCPIHVYGETKAEAEQQVAAILEDAATVLRVALVYGNSPTGRRSATEQVLRMLEKGERPRLFTDEIRSPLLADDLAQAVAELVEKPRCPSVLHLGGPQALSRYDLGLIAARAYGFDPGLLEAVPLASIDPVAPRPPDLSLDTSLLTSLLDRPPRGPDQGIAHLVESSPK